MARATYGSILTISSNDPDFPKEWGKHEWVKARTIKRQGDTEWISQQSSSAVRDNDAPDGFRMELDGVATVTATVARMVLRWGLTRDQLNEGGSPLVREDGSHVQEEIPWPADESEKGLAARLAVLREMHEDDVTYIFNRIIAQAPTNGLLQAGATTQGNSSPSAAAPSSES